MEPEECGHGSFGMALALAGPCPCRLVSTRSWKARGHVTNCQFPVSACGCSLAIGCRPCVFAEGAAGVDARRQRSLVWLWQPVSLPGTRANKRLLLRSTYVRSTEYVRNTQTPWLGTSTSLARHLPTRAPPTAQDTDRQTPRRYTALSSQSQRQRQRQSHVPAGATLTGRPRTACVRCGCSSTLDGGRVCGQRARVCGIAGSANPPCRPRRRWACTDQPSGRRLSGVSTWPWPPPRPWPLWALCRTGAPAERTADTDWGAVRDRAESSSPPPPHFHFPLIGCPE